MQQGNIERLQETAQRLSFRQFLAGITCNLADLPPSREMFRGLYDSWRQLAGQTKIQAPSSHLSFLKGYGCVALDESSSTLTWNIEKLRTTTKEIAMLLPKVYHLELVAPVGINQTQQSRPPASSVAGLSPAEVSSSKLNQIKSRIALLTLHRANPFVRI